MATKIEPFSLVACSRYYSSHRWLRISKVGSIERHFFSVEFICASFFSSKDTVLRALVGDPHRHQPLAEHHEPASIATRANEPASMYTLETRYRPIPPKVLPQRTEPELFHIEPRKAEPLDPPRRESKPMDILCTYTVSPRFYVRAQGISS